ncbi:hypothetical protein [Thermomonospora cellulosilytica]|uniref:Uncharacterized protein n=1 Tax=Thermomonospora cellulosilytica TaxID=1411118 RepID=A0A7W3MX57_9ACTN|nr:hypothetical protein [Thermomonospora cellulosilytica]MBA9003537.1 hypothetical protein [Thermomonospora cellulosilytica]
MASFAVARSAARVRHREHGSGGARGPGARRGSAGARDRPGDLDTVADDCVTAFLSALDDSLWLLAEAQRAPSCAFENAARPQDHITDLRRLVHRLQGLLLRWEEVPPQAPRGL